MLTSSAYYMNGHPETCMHCGSPFHEVNGHRVCVHVQQLGYFCCAAHADAAKMLREVPLQRRVS